MCPIEHLSTDSIRYDDLSMQQWSDRLAGVRSLVALVLTGWHIARILAMHLVADVLIQQRLRGGVSETRACLPQHVNALSL